jgi:hypothetical protein
LNSRFAINGSRIELECIICHGLIGWWYSQTEKNNSNKKIMEGIGMNTISLQSKEKMKLRDSKALKIRQNFSL